MKKKIKATISFILFVFFTIVSYSQEVNMENYITLAVQNGSQIRLYFWAEQANTPIKVVSGNEEYNLMVGTIWSEYQLYNAGADTMVIYGDLKKFDCSTNQYKINYLDAHNNTEIETILCENNSITDLDISTNSNLIYLSCFTNFISELDLNACTLLKGLNCYDNQLTELDLHKNKELTGLNCQNNRISSLILDSCSYLEGLDCQGNKLTDLEFVGTTSLKLVLCANNQISNLNISDCSSLELLSCHGNNLTTSALDEIYCSLPDREGLEAGIIRPLFNDEDEDYNQVHATNSQNASAKNWLVQYYTNDNNIPTTGDYSCTNNNQEFLINVSVYPNPVKDILTIDIPVKYLKIQMYNTAGTLILETANKQISVSDLPQGTYLLKITTDGGAYAEKIIIKE